MLGFSGCVQDDGARWSPLQNFQLMSLDAERQLGMDFDDQLEGKLQLITDPVVTGFLHDLGQQIVARVEPQPFIYRFKIVNAPSLNAFAVPGGYIYFHTGTLLAATSVDELAAVMAHEVAHVNKRHYAHRVHDRQLPSLLTQAALIAATVVSQNSAPLITGMAINVAVDLHYSRSDEAESDRLGAVYASRAGFDPGQGVYFFRRILAQQARYPNNIPPYLFSHPAVEDRIRVIEEQAKTLVPVHEPTPGTRERFRDMQARLAQLIDRRRPELFGPGDGPNARADDGDLAHVDELVQEQRLDSALAELANLSVAFPQDPRIPFRIGDVLYQNGRLDGAIAAYRRTVELDPSRGLVFYKLGIAYRDRGDRLRAVYALEQATQRGNPQGPLAARARFEVVKLTYGVIAEAGFGDGSSPSSAGTPAGAGVERYLKGAQQLVWWGRVSGRLLAKRDQIQVRWRDPSGRLLQERESALETVGRLHLVSRVPQPPTLPLASPETTEGVWTVEVLLDNAIVHRSLITVETPALRDGR
jgi:predicted Zn-dependent protease